MIFGPFLIENTRNLSDTIKFYDFVLHAPSNRLKKYWKEKKYWHFKVDAFFMGHPVF